MNTEVEKSETTKRAKTKRDGKNAKAKVTKAPRKASSAKQESAGTKKDLVLELLRRKEGATIAEIAKATNWQNHSIRGFLSGTITKKMGLAVESTKNEGEERTYHIA